MSRRRQLEHEVSVAQERIKKAAKGYTEGYPEIMGTRAGRPGIGTQ